MIGQLRQQPKSASIPESLVEGGTAPTMNGWALTENSNMDPAQVLAGDFASGFAIVDRVGTTIETLPVYGPNRLPTAERGWLMHWRTGSDAIIPGAFRLTRFTA